MARHPATAKIGRAIRENISHVVSNVMLLAEDNLKNATPIDTKNAANNWILTLRRPYTGVDGSREQPSDTAQRAGEAAVRNYDVGRDGKVYLRNNVFYMKYLNRGSSQQAPAGFVEACFMAAARRTPYGSRTAVKKMLHGMAASAYRMGY